MTERLQDLLRASTVRVQSDQGSGTGFFVAPGVVLTTVHVMTDTDPLTVTWNRDGERSRQVEVPLSQVRLPDGGSPSPALNDYGYPDVALLEVDGFDKHPCVLVDNELPSQDDTFLLFGYPAETHRRSHVSSNLAPARLSYRGLHGTLPTAYLDLTGDIIRPGMAGAAVLNLRTGRVCGILVKSHDPGMTAGGLAVPWTALSADLADLVAVNNAFHDRDRRWAVTVAQPSATAEPRPETAKDLTDPRSLTSRGEFAEALRKLRRFSGRTIFAVATEAGIAQSTLNAYLGGRHLPEDSEILMGLLTACGVNDRQVREQWRRALHRLRAPDRAARQAAEQDEDAANLLLRIYIPSKQIYFAEAPRLLSLFRDWLVQARAQIVRQTSYRTAAGEMFEFYTDANAAPTDLKEQFDSFSNFLELCAQKPTTAADLLAAGGVGRAESTEMVARFGREARRLQIDMRHDWERRTMTLRHRLEEELHDRGSDLAITSDQINALIDSLVPRPFAPASRSLLVEPQSIRGSAPVNIQINQQNVTALESTIIQYVQGNGDLTTEAKQLLDLIAQYEHNVQERALLQASVHELANPSSRPADRSVAHRRLKEFASQLAGIARDVAVQVLAKLAESGVPGVHP